MEFIKPSPGMYMVRLRNPLFLYYLSIYKVIEVKEGPIGHVKYLNIETGSEHTKAFNAFILMFIPYFLQRRDTIKIGNKQVRVEIEDIIWENNQYVLSTFEGLKITSIDLRNCKINFLEK